MASRPEQGQAVGEHHQPAEQQPGQHRPRRRRGPTGSGGRRARARPVPRRRRRRTSRRADTAMNTAVGPRTRNGTARRAAASAPSARSGHQHGGRGRRADRGDDEARGQVAAEPDPHERDVEQQGARRMPGDMRRPVVRLRRVGDAVDELAQRRADVVDLRARRAGSRSGARARRRSRSARSSASASIQASAAAYDTSRRRRHASVAASVEGVAPAQQRRARGRGMVVSPRCGSQRALQRREGARRDASRARTSQPVMRGDRRREQHQREREAETDTGAPARRRLSGSWPRPEARCAAVRLGAVGGRTSWLRKSSGPRTPKRRPTFENVDTTCDLILPCRDEAPALRALLPRGAGRLPGDRGGQRLERRHRLRSPVARRHRGRRGPCRGTAPPCTPASRRPPPTTSP